MDRAWNPAYEPSDLWGHPDDPMVTVGPQAEDWPVIDDLTLEQSGQLSLAPDVAHEEEQAA